MSTSQPVQVEPGKGVKQSYVVAGAILSCSCGTQPTRLELPLSHGVSIKGKAQANVEDYVSGRNIVSFGNCSSVQNPAVQSSTMVDSYGVKKSPCVPVLTMPWIGGKEDVQIEGRSALLSGCRHQCLYGGSIRIEDDGQNLE